MKNPMKIPTLLAAMAFLFITAGCALTQKTKQIKPLKITGGEEILVAEDISTFTPFWCGDKPILVYQLSEGGVYYYDLSTRKKTKVAVPYTHPTACTHDGEWLIYRDSRTIRKDEGTELNYISDLWRYELKTGKNERFIIVDDHDAWSSIQRPEADTLYLSRRANLSIEMPEPKWSLAIDPRHKVIQKWLKDGSVGIGSFLDLDQPIISKRQTINVEVFHPERRSFNLDPDFDNFDILFSDDQNRLYIHVERSYLVRCSINTKEETLSCSEPLFSWEHAWGLDVLPDGENIIFSRPNDDCVKAQMIGKDNIHCVTKKGLVVNTSKISRNGKWLAFEKFNLLKEGYPPNDLYITSIQITKETN